MNNFELLNILSDDNEKLKQDIFDDLDDITSTVNLKVDLTQSEVSNYLTERYKYEHEVYCILTKIKYKLIKFKYKHKCPILKLTNVKKEDLGALDILTLKENATKLLTNLDKHYQKYEDFENLSLNLCSSKESKEHPAFRSSAIDELSLFLSSSSNSTQTDKVKSEPLSENSGDAIELDPLEPFAGKNDGTIHQEGSELILFSDSDKSLDRTDSEEAVLDLASTGQNNKTGPCHRGSVKKSKRKATLKLFSQKRQKFFRSYLTSSKQIRVVKTFSAIGLSTVNPKSTSDGGSIIDFGANQTTAAKHISSSTPKAKTTNDKTAKRILEDDSTNTSDPNFKPISDADFKPISDEDFQPISDSDLRPTSDADFKTNSHADFKPTFAADFKSTSAADFKPISDADSKHASDAVLETNKFTSVVGRTSERIKESDSDADFAPTSDAGSGHTSDALFKKIVSGMIIGGASEGIKEPSGVDIECGSEVTVKSSNATGMTCSNVVIKPADVTCQLNSGATESKFMGRSELPIAKAGINVPTSDVISGCTDVTSNDSYQLNSGATESKFVGRSGVAISKANVPTSDVGKNRFSGCTDANSNDSCQLNSGATESKLVGRSAIAKAGTNVPISDVGKNEISGCTDVTSNASCQLNSGATESKFVGRSGLAIAERRQKVPTSDVGKNEVSGCKVSKLPPDTNHQSVQRKDLVSRLKELEEKKPKKKVKVALIPETVTLKPYRKAPASSLSNIRYNIKDKRVPKLPCKCIFSHIESPSEFYIHIYDEESQLLDVLNEQISDYFEGSTPPFQTKKEAQKCIGQFCCVYLEEYKMWHRAEVLSWKPKDRTSDQVMVHLVDYGNYCYSIFKNLRPITKELALMPKLALKCYLPMLYPPNSDQFNLQYVWPKESIEAFMNLAGYFDRDVMFDIVYMEQDGDSFAIDLHAVTDNPEWTIGQLLIDLKHAVQIVLPEDDPDGIIMDEEEIEEFEKHSNINEAIIGYNPRDEARICPFTRSDGTCFKGKHCRMEHGQIRKDGFTTDKQVVAVEANNVLRLPKESEHFSLQFTAFRNITHFYVNLVSHATGLKRLEETINNPATLKTLKTFNISPAPGEIVLVKHWTKRWLRAKVRHQMYDEAKNWKGVQVFMVDYGDIVDVEMKDIRRIKDEFLELPFQAVECKLNNFRPNKKVEFSEVDEYFHSKLCFKTFTAIVVSSCGSLLCLDIYRGNKHLGDVLQENGLVIPADYSNLFPAHDSYVLLG